MKMTTSVLIPNALMQLLDTFINMHFWSDVCRYTLTLNWTETLSSR